MGTIRSPARYACPPKQLVSQKFCFAQGSCPTLEQEGTKFVVFGSVTLMDSPLRVPVSSLPPTARCGQVVSTCGAGRNAEFTELANGSESAEGPQREHANN